MLGLQPDAALCTVPLRYNHPRSPNAERSTPGGAYHPLGAITGTELQSDLLVAIRNP